MTCGLRTPVLLNSCVGRPEAAAVPRRSPPCRLSAVSLQRSGRPGSRPACRQLVAHPRSLRPRRRAGRLLGPPAAAAGRRRVLRSRGCRHLDGCGRQCPAALATKARHSLWPALAQGGAFVSISPLFRHVAGVLAQLLGKAPLPDDIPAEHEYLDRYGPSYTLSAGQGLGGVAFVVSATDCCQEEDGPPLCRGLRTQPCGAHSVLAGVPPAVACSPCCSHQAPAPARHKRRQRGACSLRGSTSRAPQRAGTAGKARRQRSSSSSTTKTGLQAGTVMMRTQTVRHWPMLSSACLPACAHALNSCNILLHQITRDSFKAQHRNTSSDASKAKGGRGSGQHMAGTNARGQRTRASSWRLARPARLSRSAAAGCAARRVRQWWWAAPSRASAPKYTRERRCCLPARCTVAPQTLPAQPAQSPGERGGGGMGGLMQCMLARLADAITRHQFCACSAPQRCGQGSPLAPTLPRLQPPHQREQAHQRHPASEGQHFVALLSVCGKGWNEWNE